jgi:hypothetical protein
MEDVGSHLEYFQELEHATRMLNHPGESLIFQADFHYMVERVDICIEFLKGHVCFSKLNFVFNQFSLHGRDIIERQTYIYLDFNSA